MKPEELEINEEADEDVQLQITGDVIGDTAYSERFVLKILLKFANLNTFKDEVQEKSFEEELCTLWDMTAEKDVVNFLQKHSALKLFNFALPTIESERIIEIILGIIGNMCCDKQAVKMLLSMNDLLNISLDYLKCADVTVIVQVFRLVNACLYLSENDDTTKWLHIFESIDYSSSLYFILKNSSNKEVLVNAVENLNTICSQCNIEQNRCSFFKQFVNLTSFDALNSAFLEIKNKQRGLCDNDEFERLLFITLQIILNLIGFDVSKDLYKDRRKETTYIIKCAVSYFEDKFVNKKQIDSDIIDIVDSIFTAVCVLELSEINDLEEFFDQTYSMWVACSSILMLELNETNSRDSQEESNSVNNFAEDFKGPLSKLMCKYMQCCSEDNLLQVLEKIGKNYNIIINNCNDEDVKKSISLRAKNYRTRIEENVDL